jgi:predicted metal-dependent phosphoesterase TrpH
MRNPDLHSHSTVSDGTLAPAALIERAVRCGVSTLALTDHDDTGGLAEAAVAAKALGLNLINGVEISVTWRDQTIHVVGLGIDPANRGLQDGLEATRAGRVIRSQRMAAAFDVLGIEGTLEGAQRLAGNPRMIGRAHFARHLREAGKVKNLQDAFHRWLGAGRPCNVELQWAALDEAIGWIRNAGGLAVIAHPGRYPLDGAQLRALCREFSDLGGAALEVVTSSHQPQQYTAFAKLAADFGLAASVGSDFHSPQESRDLGNLPPLPAGCEPVWRMLVAA